MKLAVQCNKILAERQLDACEIYWGTFPREELRI